jgi:hypothetical protein
MKSGEKTSLKRVNLCMSDIMNSYTILGHIRSGYFGDVYAVANGKHKGSREYHTMKKYTGKKFDYIMKVTSNNKVAMDEVTMLYAINKIGSVHLPKLISHHKCDSMRFRGSRKQGIALSHKDWTFVKKGKGLITLMENSGVGMDLYLKKNRNPMNEVIMIFQLLCTLYLLKKNKIVHNDIYMPNIVCKPVKDTSMAYNIDGTVMRVPILDGHVPVLIDFGQAQTTNVGSPDINTEMLLSTWYHYTANPEMKQFLGMLREKPIHNLKSFIVDYYRTHIGSENNNHNA